jgi:alanine-glyoxylate transaminase / (R)-3-amino-2-methylpropionate-pyruvate transaminase
VPCPTSSIPNWSTKSQGSTPELVRRTLAITSSGMEVNELAILMTRLYTGSHNIISLLNSYHENATRTMGATAQKNWNFNVI